MMRLLVAALILVTAQAASLLGSDKCTWGPSYWCSSVQTATKCQTFTHCLDTVWKDQLLDVQKTEICKFSQKSLETARQVLPLNDGEAQANHLMASICINIDDDSKRQECKDVVTNYMPEILKLINSSVESSTVATVLGLCQPDTDTADETPEDETAEDGPYYPPTNATICSDCHAFITDLQTLIKKPGSEEQFTTIMADIICSDLGDLVVLCKAFVETRLPKLYKFLAENDNPEMVCRLGDLCIDTVGTKSKRYDVFDALEGTLRFAISDENLDVKEGEIPCSECNKVLTSVTAFEKDSHFRNSVQEAVRFLCSHTDLGEEKCRLLSDGLIPKEFVSMMSRDLDVNDICTSTLRCADPLSEAKPASETDEQVTPSSSFCTDCLRFFGDVRDVLRDNVSVPEAAALAKEYVCQDAGPYEFPCNDFMEGAMPIVLNYLASVDSPPTVCSDMTLCPKPEFSPKFDIVKAFDAAWDKKPLGDFKCDECQILVQDARDEDRNPDVQKAIVDFFNGICDQLENSTRAQCKALVQQYLPQLFEIIASELEPSVLCELLLRCTKPEYDAEDTPIAQPGPEETVLKMELGQTRPWKKSKKNSAIYDQEETLEEKVGESVECAICRLAVESIDQVIASNSTEQMIEEGLQRLCNILPSSVLEACDDFVATYTPGLIELLVQELDPLLICDELQVCNETESSFIAPVLQAAEKLKQETKEGKTEKAGDTVERQICELVVGTVDSILAENRSKAAIQSALDDICNILSSGIRPQCLSFVNEYSDVVVQLLLQELQPQQVCVFIGICQQNETVAVPELGSKLPGGPLCSICELVVTQLDTVLGSNRSEAAVQNALEQVCGFFPDTISAECQNFVNTYGPSIINLLVQEIDPQKICKLLGLCSSAVGNEAEVAPIPEATAPAMTAGPLCSLCELVVNQLDVLIANNETEAAVENALDQVCTLFPPNVSAECTSLIRLYAPAIINLLLQEIEPKDVCRRLGLCSSSARVTVTLPEVLETLEAAATGDAECEVCKIIITEINNIIGDDKSEAALIHAIETVCDVVSGDLRLQCKSEVENYGPAVFDLLQHIDNPSEVCKAIKLCANSDSNASGNEKTVKVSDGEVCLICQTLANYAGEAAKEQSTADEVEKLLKDICTVLPQNITSTCSTLVDQFTPMILHLLAEKDNPLEICQDIGLCPKDNMEAQRSMVGVDSCTFGPAFWCANRENALKCGMVEDCMKYGAEF